MKIIQITDKLNSHLFQGSLSTTHSIRKNYDNSSGIRVIETPHPYNSKNSHKEVVSMQNVSFFSLVFDEQCGTSGGHDVLQLYTDIECTQPFDKPFYGSSSRWPKHSLHVMGDTVVFNFQASSEHKHENWGYRCVVIPHRMDTSEPDIPWSVHLEKTMCCLGGHLAGLLITGEGVGEEEIMMSNFFELELFKYGIKESVDQNFMGNELFKSFIRSKRDSLNQDANNWFYEDLFKLKGKGSIFFEKMEKESGSRSPFLLPVIKEAQSSTLAALLKHTNLAQEALLSLDNQPTHQIKTIWKYLEKVKNCIMQKHQEKQYHDMLVEELDVVNKRKLKNFPPIHEARENSYREIVEQIKEKSRFLLENFVPWNSPIEVKCNQILKFILESPPFPSFMSISAKRTSRAFTRILGLNAMKDLLMSSKKPFDSI